MVQGLFRPPRSIAQSRLQKYEHFLNCKLFKRKKDIVHDNATSEFASQEQQIQDFEAPPAPEAEPLNPEPDYDPDRPFGGVPTVTNEDVHNVTNMRLTRNRKSN